MHNQVVELPNGGVRICECCGSNAARMCYSEQKFYYGDGNDSVELAARVPVWTCQSCGDQYTDSAAEEIRHEVICDYLGRLTPADIVRLRKIYDLSQSELATLTGIGLASIKRWESGNQIQNESFDKYLRLLFDGKNVEALKRPKSLESLAGNNSRIKFRTKFSPEVMLHAAAFSLRRKSAELAVALS